MINVASRREHIVLFFCSPEIDARLLQTMVIRSILSIDTFVNQQI